MNDIKSTLDVLTRIFRDIFDDDTIVLSDATSADDIDEWDSLAQINLVLAIEAYYRLRFDPSEIESLRNIGDMVQLILKKNENK